LATFRRSASSITVGRIGCDPRILVDLQRCAVPRLAAESLQARRNRAYPELGTAAHGVDVMRKPKNMTPEQEAAWKQKVAAKHKAYYESNLEKMASRAKTYRESHPEKVSAMRRAWRESNPEKVAALRKAAIENLTPFYVARTFALKTSELTPELLELKRNQLLIHRALKQLKQTLNGETS